MTNGEMLGKKLYELRKKNGLSQEELAERLGVSRQAVSKWECGESMPDTDNLITIARMYAISLDELVGNEAARSDIHDGESRGEDGACDGESQKSDGESEGKKKSKLEDFFDVACPLLVTAAFLICGFLWGIWHIAWILFFIIPTCTSLVEAVKKKKVSEFLFVAPVTAIYCFIGMTWGLWGSPYWLIFITVPIYYEIAEAIDKRAEKKKKQEDSEAEK